MAVLLRDIIANGLTDYLWPIVREIIKTAIENEHVNQIELHPFFSQYAAIENMKGYGTT